MTNLKNVFPLQFVINLDKRPDRLEKVKNQFSWLGLEPMRMPGKIYNDSRNHSSWNGALGCLFSHLSILRFAHDMQQNVFIFEDDFKMIDIDTSWETIERATNELNEVEWDMFYLGGNILRPFQQVSDYLAKLQHCQSTVSYGVRWQFIEKLFPYFEMINAPIDVIYADRVIPNSNAYITIPMVGIQEDSFSDIEGQQANYSSYLEKRYWANLIKMLDK
jgi:GR25 family glycosyltransferase involved in LPS biosynthesis